jgi:hypothetical protein
MTTNKTTDPISGKTDAGRHEVEKESNTNPSATDQAKENPTVKGSKTDAG